MDGIECFAIAESSVTQNWLQISDRQGSISVNGFLKYYESSVVQLPVFEN